MKELIAKLDDENTKKELYEAIEEDNTLINYYHNLIRGFGNQNEVHNYVVSIINKYRYKLEVKCYYQNPGKDDLGNNIGEEIKNAQRVVETFIQVKLSIALKETTTDELNKNNASN